MKQVTDRLAYKKTHWYKVFRSAWKVGKLFIRQRIIGFNMPTSPHFDSMETTRWFISKLKESRNYLEYGSGGSTYLAAQYGVPFVCVDSDGFFLKQLKNKIESDGFLNESNQTYHHANIGLTEGWGRPAVFKQPSIQRLNLFRKYSDLPEVYTRKLYIPDLILVDGRFRVACALKILQFLGDKKGWTLIVDDYVNRPQYHVIEEYAQLKFCVGRMAVFNEIKSSQPESLESTIRQYEVIPD